MLSLRKINKGDRYLQSLMARHYSAPKGFVGRQIFYRVGWGGRAFGCIAFGSATKHLPGREIVGSLNNGVNNIFYHVEPPPGGYPCRNFTTAALLRAEEECKKDWDAKYSEWVGWFETLVELPRTGDLYLKAGYAHVGTTKGYTCKRVAGASSDSWSGQRKWDVDNLRPKLVFYKATR